MCALLFHLKKRYMISSTCAWQSFLFDTSTKKFERLMTLIQFNSQIEIAVYRFKRVWLASGPEKNKRLCHSTIYHNWTTSSGLCNGLCHFTIYHNWTISSCIHGNCDLASIEPCLNNYDDWYFRRFLTMPASKRREPCAELSSNHVWILDAWDEWLPPIIIHEASMDMCIHMKTFRIGCLESGRRWRIMCSS